MEDAAGAAHLARSLAGQPVALYADDAWHISDGRTQWQARPCRPPRPSPRC